MSVIKAGKIDVATLQSLQKKVQSSLNAAKKRQSTGKSAEGAATKLATESKALDDTVGE